jgi:undecaprenyl-diphosphatase
VSDSSPRPNQHADGSSVRPQLAFVFQPFFVALSLVLAVRLWLERIGPLPTERWSLRFTPWPPRPEPWRDIGTVVEIFGTPLFAALSILLAVWLVARGMGLRAMTFVIVCCAGLVVEDLMKRLLGPTPLWSEARPGNLGQTANLPSGHVVYFVLLGGALAILASQRRRWDLVAIVAVFVAVAGPSRVWMGVHLPSDVLTAYVFGAGWVFSAYRLFFASRKRGTLRGLILGPRAS